MPLTLQLDRRRIARPSASARLSRVEDCADPPASKRDIDRPADRRTHGRQQTCVAARRQFDGDGVPPARRTQPAALAWAPPRRTAPRARTTPAMPKYASTAAASGTLTSDQPDARPSPSAVAFDRSLSSTRTRGRMAGGDRVVGKLSHEVLDRLLRGRDRLRTAYARTNERLKMPPGRCEMSLRSSASSARTEILVAFGDLAQGDAAFRSRASRSLAPKSPACDRQFDDGRRLAAYVSSHRTAVKPAQRPRRRYRRAMSASAESWHARVATSSMNRPIAAIPAPPARATSATRSIGHAADRQHRHAIRPHDRR